MLQASQALGPQHFAFMRAGLQGLDLRQSWRRYLAANAPASDLAQLQSLQRSLWRTVVERAEALASIDLPSGVLPALRALLGAPGRRLAAAEELPRAQDIPDLASFIAEHGGDEDLYSQSEWLALYREQVLAITNAAASTSESALVHARAAEAAQHRQQVLAALQALNRVEPLLARQAQPTDALALWLAPPTLRRLEPLGCPDLAALAQVVADGGHHWTRIVQGLGRLRGDAIAHWLGDLQRRWGRPWPRQRWQAIERARQRWLGEGTDAHREPSTSNVPPAPRPLEWWLARLPDARVDADLSGRPAHPVRSVPASGLRLPRAGLPPDTLRADLSWLVRWLAPWPAHTPTGRAYRKEAERFVQWLWLERRQPLLACTAQALPAYTRFVQQVPPQWCCTTALPRSDPDWRPFRGALGRQSTRLALGVVQRLLSALPSPDGLPDRPRPQPGLPRLNPTADSHGTLVAVPTAEVQARPGQPRRMSGRAAPSHGACARRLHLLVLLMGLPGLRLEDLPDASVQMLRDAALPLADDATRWRIFLADGRDLPVSSTLALAIRSHWADVLSPTCRALPSQLPLLCALRAGVPRWEPLVHGDVALLSPRVLTQPRAVSLASLRLVWHRHLAR